jgi:hypothetical protein
MAESEWMAAAIEWVRVLQRYLWGFIVVLALLLWGPRWLISGLGMSAVLSHDRLYFGLSFAVLLGMGLSDPISLTVRWPIERLEEIMWRKAKVKRLHDLTPHEKTILREYIDNETRTQYLSIGNGVVSGLVHEKILYRSANIGNLSGFAYNIQPWAFDYLRQHPELLGLDTPRCTVQ